MNEDTVFRAQECVRDYDIFINGIFDKNVCFLNSWSSTVAARKRFAFSFSQKKQRLSKVSEALFKNLGGEKSHDVEKTRTTML